MSYAIETKKRKFDRLLESLTESFTQQPQPADTHVSPRLVSHGSSARLSKSKDFDDGSKRRRATPVLSKSVSRNSLINHYLPSSRAAFLERLETFRHVTKWHVPSTLSINASAWAKRGWICVDVDTVSCGSCSERVVVDLAVEIHAIHNDDENTNDAVEEEANKSTQQQEEDEADMMVNVYEALVKRYRDMITTSHSENCPWRQRGCDASIQRIEGLFNTSAVVASTRCRVESILAKIEDVPPVSDLPPYDEVLLPNAADLTGFNLEKYNDNAVKLAICGWQYKEADVVECKNCFRSLGLWLYRGETPTVEHLDAVESHLEYCPWRSPEAQDTEVIHHDKQGENKLKLPGWALVYCAVKKQHQKTKGERAASTVSASETTAIGADREQLTPEQREKKMKDLMRRIKEIKKPFNVKSLLRKKDKPDT